jgi:hypothetical protein
MLRAMGTAVGGVLAAAGRPKKKGTRKKKTRAAVEEM